MTTPPNTNQEQELRKHRAELIEMVWNRCRYGTTYVTEPMAKDIADYILANYILKSDVQAHTAQQVAEADRNARINENDLWYLRARSIKSKSIMSVSFKDRNAGLQDGDGRAAEYFFRDERVTLTPTKQDSGKGE